MHAARHGWDLEKDAPLFMRWAIHTGNTQIPLFEFILTGSLFQGLLFSNLPNQFCLKLDKLLIASYFLVRNHSQPVGMSHSVRPKEAVKKKTVTD